MSFDSKLGNDFLRVPRLPADGKGFVVWKERLELSIRARGLFGHLDGTVTKPDELPTPVATEGVTGAGHCIPTDRLDNSRLVVLEDKGEIDREGSLGYTEGRFREAIAHDHDRPISTIYGLCERS